MGVSSILAAGRDESVSRPPRPQGRNWRSQSVLQTPRFPAQNVEVDISHRHAELFYLQKQIYSQTQMVIVLEDGERVEGCIEWYDRNTLKVRGKVKSLVYKSAIKYMYKLGDNGP